MKNLQLSQQEAARELLARRKARRSLVDYARYIEVPGAPLSEDSDDCEVVETQLAEHHVLILEAAQRCIEKHSGRLMLFMPPGSAKSTYGSVVVPSWCMGRTPGFKVIGVSYGSDMAKKFGRRTRSIIKQKKYQACFSRWQRNYARYMRQEHNSPFGPLYKRMAEKAQKISLTLGLDEGIVTAEHVRWAVAAAWMDAQSKIEMVSQWDKEYSKKINIKDIVLSEVKKRPNNTIGKLCSARCLRDEDRDKVKNALDALVREKRITVKKTKNKRNGSDVLKYASP